MGYSSEWSIQMHNEQMDTDADYRDEYAEAMEADAYLFNLHWHQMIEEEKFYEYFNDRLIDYKGNAVILPEPELIDDDLPF